MPEILNIGFSFLFVRSDNFLNRFSGTCTLHSNGYNVEKKIFECMKQYMVGTNFQHQHHWKGRIFRYLHFPWKSRKLWADWTLKIWSYVKYLKKGYRWFAKHWRKCMKAKMFMDSQIAGAGLNGTTVDASSSSEDDDK